MKNKSGQVDEGSGGFSQMGSFGWVVSLCYFKFGRLRNGLMLWLIEFSRIEPVLAL